MSPLLPDELRVLLYPDHIELIRFGTKLSWRGLRRTEHARDTLVHMADDHATAPWERALKGLESALSKQAGRRVSATVIVSNHFVRYVVVPWSDSLSNEDEEAAFTRHCFKSTFGEAADHWDLRLSPGRPGVAQLASGIDVPLLQAVRNAFSQAGIALRSVQPHLMAAYNACSSGLRGRTAWFVVCEQGNLCLGLLQHGNWSAVRAVRVDEDWRAQLPLILDRESCLVAPYVDTDEVLLWAPEAGPVEMPRGVRWNFRSLRVPSVAVHATAGEAPFAMAAGGGLS